VVGTISHYHSHPHSAETSLRTRILYTFMGGVVHDGGSLCRVYFGDHPLLKVLSSDLDLGNGEREEGKEFNDKCQMTNFK
jgi:hypothetical protein